MNRPPGRRIVIASSNAGKLREFAALPALAAYTLLPQRELGIDDAEETAATFAGNALLKARHAADASGLIAIADDSGLCVDALQGRPGVYSARYGGAGLDDAGRNRRLLEELAGVPTRARAAHYHCAIACAAPGGVPPLVCEASWQGHLLETPRGTGGFGYDPLFVPAGDRRTAAELPLEEKNRQSHRALALMQLAARLPAWLATQ
ncbi:MAG: RdgB/HAM1 family non-canonical purine NTP pyrophosphatase [Steroidobacteraceae bacterium]